MTILPISRSTPKFVVCLRTTSLQPLITTPSKRIRLPQGNVLKNQSPSKFYPNPQAKSILGLSPCKHFSKQKSWSNPQTGRMGIRRSTLSEIWQIWLVYTKFFRFLIEQIPKLSKQIFCCPQAPQAKGMLSPSKLCPLLGALMKGSIIRILKKYLSHREELNLV